MELIRSWADFRVSWPTVEQVAKPIELTVILLADFFKWHFAIQVADAVAENRVNLGYRLGLKIKS